MNIYNLTAERQNLLDEIKQLSTAKSKLYGTQFVIPVFNLYARLLEYLKAIIEENCVKTNEI